MKNCPRGGRGSGMVRVAGPGTTVGERNLCRAGRRQYVTPVPWSAGLGPSPHDAARARVRRAAGVVGRGPAPERVAAAATGLRAGGGAAGGATAPWAGVRRAGGRVDVRVGGRLAAAPPAQDELPQAGLQAVGRAG